MAKLSSDGKYVTVESGDTLSEIAEDYGNGKSWQSLAAINGLANPHLIHPGKKIYLEKTPDSNTGGSSGNAPKIVDFGIQCGTNDRIFATWNWSWDHTKSYKTLWSYDNGDGRWFVGSDSETTVDKDNPAGSRQSIYTIPENATRIKFKVKPISEKKKVDGKEDTDYWTASWSTERLHTVIKSPEKPSTPKVKIDNFKLTATLENWVSKDMNADGVQFQIVKNDLFVFNTGTAFVYDTVNYVEYTCTVEAGNEYKVRCRSYRGTLYSEWSDYSANIGTVPSAPKGITSIKAASETSVQLSWDEVPSAKTYDIEYATKKEYFDISDQTSTVTGIKTTTYQKTGLESGEEYFFRVRAVNDAGESPWTDVKSVIVGTDPAAPTTWSSTTTAITGEPLNLYWVHNSEDGSSQTYAELEICIGTMVSNEWVLRDKITETIKNTTDEDEKDKTSVYAINTKNYSEGVIIKWRVRTAGITLNYGDWSVQRTIDIYAPPTLEFRVTDRSGNAIYTLESFPFYIKGLAGPNTQAPIGYHVTITANETYETVDSVGNVKMVKAGEAVYSKYFNISTELALEMSASNIDLENNISYTVNCTVSMDSGLTAESSSTFVVAWTDNAYMPNAEIGLDADTLVTHIKPYCVDVTTTYYEVEHVGYSYYNVTDKVVNNVYGTVVDGAKTTTGYQVYSGTTSDDEEVLYCVITEERLIDGVTLAVYRREFDGTYTELGSGIKNTNTTFITDPHPSLDYARYRIVATTDATGSVAYYDMPGYPIREKAAIIQWDEDWVSFEVSSDDEMEKPVWSGSMLKLPYNIDVSDKRDPDVSLVEYIGRKHPVSYYGTQIGESQSWSMEIPADDKETLYALRRLSIWMGDVYVREPSGSGYWAKITVSFKQTHCAVTIPITIDVVRVEGGM